MDNTQNNEPLPELTKEAFRERENIRKFDPVMVIADFGGPVAGISEEA